MAAPLGHRLPAGGGRAAAAVRPVARARSSRRPSIAAQCAFDLRLVAPRLPDFPVPPGHTEQTWLVELVRRGATDRYGPRGAERVARGLGPARPRAGRHRRPRVPRLLPHRVGHRDLLPAATTSSARAGARPPPRPSVTPSASPTSTPSPSACCSSASSPPPATGRRTSTSTSSRAGAKRPSSTSTSATAGGTPPRWPTSSPTAPARPSATWARPSATTSRRSTAGPSRSTGASRSANDEDLPPLVREPGHRAARLPPPPRHPLGGHGHLRPPGGRGLPGGVGPDAGPHRAPVGQGRLRRRRAGQVRPARAWACSPPSTTWSTWSGPPPRDRSTWPASTRSPPSTTCCAGPTPWGCSRWSRGPR